MPHVMFLCMDHCQHLTIIIGMIAGGSYLHNLLDVKVDLRTSSSNWSLSAIQMDSET